MKKFSELVFKHRKTVIFLTTILTIFLGYFIKDIKIDPDILNYLPKSDPYVELSTHISEEYGGYHLAMVAMETDYIFAHDSLQELNQLTKDLQKLEGVASVSSLTNIIDIKDNDGWIEIGNLLDPDKLPQTKEEMDELKSYIMSKDMYKGKLFSTDETTALIICQIADGVDKVDVAKDIKEYCSSLDLGANLYYGGQPFYLLEINNTILSDLKTLVPLVVILIVTILYISFRSLIGVVYPLLSVAISIIWTIGIMCMAKVPLTIISDVIPVILIAVGSAYSIHMLNSFNETRVDNQPRERARLTLERIGVPIMLAAVTTVAGFVSFIFGSYLTMIQQFGFFTALGVVFALIISITLIPILLSFVKTKDKSKRTKETKSSSLLTNLGDLIYKRKLTIVFLATITVIIALVGIPSIERKVDIIDYFKPDSSMRQAEELIMNNKFGGSIPLQILVEGDIQDPAVLREMKAVQDFIKTLKHVNNPFSIVDLMLELNASMGDGREIPDRYDKVTNLWFFIDGQEIVDQMVKRDKSEALIQATTVYAQMDEITSLVDQIDNFLDELKPQAAKFSQTGMHAIYKNLDESLLESQIKSIFISLTLILIIISLLLGSLYGGIIGLVPILFTLAVIFGFMGYAKIPLDIATVLVAGISVGIGIDYAIHFISRFRIEMEKNKDQLLALKVTLETSGKGILINMITVAGGFLIFLFADLVPLQRFGSLVALTMFSSGFVSLLVLPAILLFLKKDSKLFNPTRKKQT